MSAAFGIVKVECGAAVRFARSRAYGVLGYGSEIRTGRGLSTENRFIRSDPCAGIGVRF